ncbi:DUF4363 family protein [Clostridium formicaceticum]|uniref:DUF4363 domain-containing protein n=1 Tax=Clostridium formicaceticum TaxID=1497 RepID=A0AAC9WHY1_9CLOT|nr:DUF4363 family protein [Clostridium formicaceticum]AOY75042.1 hypothetical protein BJL90_03490 [Clostridium formicaceticum]ARE89461.1 hypothetical protein CLFO_39390 [Clostridium formicaceticum]
MKVVVATVLILIIFFTSSLLLNQYIERTSKEITDMIQKLEVAIEKEDWKEGQAHMEDIVKQWHKTRNMWQTFLEHYEIDAIDIVLAKVEKYVSIEERTLSLGGIAELELLIEHIIGKGEFKLTNIL